MATIIILHVSDLQSSCGSCQRWAPNGHYGEKLHSILYDGVAQAIGNNPKVEMVLVTGDIAQTGNEREYEAARDFLTELLKSLGNPKLLVVPGDHDVNRKKYDVAKGNNPSQQDCFKAKFEDYNSFLSELGHPEVTFQIPYVEKLIEVDKEFSVRVTGLNSCMVEGSETASHYGEINNDQLKGVKEYLDQQVESPYVLRIAAFHHNPLLIGSPIESKLIELAHSGTDGAEQFKFLQDYLHNAEQTLQKLSQAGFSLVLHGHQHFDGVLWVNFPSGKPGEPFIRQGIAALGAGSIIGYQHNTGSGATNKTLQPSVQLLSIETIPWGWEITCHQIGIHTDKEESTCSRKVRFRVPRAKTLEPLLAITETFKSIAPVILPNGQQDTFNFTDRGYGKYVIWKSDTPSSLGTKELKLILDQNQTSKSGDRLPEELVDDLRKVGLYGVRSWSEGENLYGNYSLFKLSKLEIVNNVPKPYVRRSCFAHTRILNWQLQLKVLRPRENQSVCEEQAVSFRKKWLLPYIYNNNPHKIFEDHPYLGYRNETTVLATVKRNAKDYLIVRLRSKTLPVEPETIMLFTSGVCRFEEQDLKLIDGARAEMNHETGYLYPQSNFDLIGLHLDPMYFTPVWFYRLQINEEEFEKNFMDIQYSGHDVVRLEKKSGADRVGRDDWEAGVYYAVPLTDTDDNWENVVKRICKGVAKCVGKNSLEMAVEPSVGLWVWFNSYYPGGT